MLASLVNNVKRYIPLFQDRKHLSSSMEQTPATAPTPIAGSIRDTDCEADNHVLATATSPQPFSGEHKPLGMEHTCT